MFLGQVLVAVLLALGSTNIRENIFKVFGKVQVVQTEGTSEGTVANLNMEYD